MSGGSLGVNVIDVGGNVNCEQYRTNRFAERWHGSVHANGRIRRRIRQGRLRGDEPGHWSGSGRQLEPPLRFGSASTFSSLGTYTLGNANGTGSPLFVGGVEAIGITGTGTFTQNCGTNAIVGGGDFAGTPGSIRSRITAPPAPSCSAGIAANKETP